MEVGRNTFCRGGTQSIGIGRGVEAQDDDCSVDVAKGIVEDWGRGGEGGWAGPP
jgi:hypothetical protein